jgi:hypothetical protein
MHALKAPTLISRGFIPASDGSRSRLIAGTLPAKVSTIPLIEGRALPLTQARIWLAGHSFTIASADDYGGAKICDFQNKNLLLKGFLLNAKGTITSPNVGTELTLGLGSAVAAATPLASTAIAYMAAKTGVGAAQAFTCIGHSFDESAPALVFLDAHATNNDLFLNGAAAVASGTCTVAFTDGYVDVFYHDLDEPVAL